MSFAGMPRCIVKEIGLDGKGALEKEIERSSTVETARKKGRDYPVGSVRVEQGVDLETAFLYSTTKKSTH